MIEGFEINSKTIDNDYTELNGCETNKYIANQRVRQFANKHTTRLTKF